MCLVCLVTVGDRRHWQPIFLYWALRGSTEDHHGQLFVRHVCGAEQPVSLWGYAPQGQLVYKALFCRVFEWWEWFPVILEAVDMVGRRINLQSTVRSCRVFFHVKLGYELNFILASTAFLW